MVHSDRPIAAFHGPAWLADLIEFAVRRDYCVKINCSTCCATGVRNALWASAEDAAPLTPSEEIAHQLAILPEGTSAEAMRLVIYNLHRRVRGEAWDRLSQVFATGPAGREHARMQRHHERIDDIRSENAYLNSPELAAERRAQRSERTQQRLQDKAMRDAKRKAGGPYDLIEHRHRLAAWSAARAASRGVGGLKVSQVEAWVRRIGLRRLVADWTKLPEPDDFDRVHLKWRLELIRKARKEKLLCHGGAAKIINCYLKVGVVCASAEPNGEVPMAVRAKIGALHPPVDRILRDTILKRTGAEIYRRNVAWSLLGSDDYQAAINRLREVAGNEPAPAESAGVTELWRVERYWAGFAPVELTEPEA